MDMITLSELLKGFKSEAFQESPTCGILGASPMCFPWGFDEEDEHCIDLKQALSKQILYLNAFGIDNFSVVCDPGVGLWCGEFINQIRDDIRLDIRLHCHVPYEEHTNKWHPELRRRYYDMMIACDFEYLDCETQSDTARLDACRAVVDTSSILLVVQDDEGKHDPTLDMAIQYAKSQNKQVNIMHPLTFKITRSN